MLMHLDSHTPSCYFDFYPIYLVLVSHSGMMAQCVKYFVFCSCCCSCSHPWEAGTFFIDNGVLPQLVRNPRDVSIVCWSPTRSRRLLSTSCLAFNFSIVAVSCRHTFTAANACLWHNIWHSVLCHVGQQHGITLRAGANMQRRRCMPSCVTRAWQIWRNWKFWFIPMIPKSPISLHWR